ncbi:hypothetical protein Agub_g4490 [Astrephomene gubernaculifera]|uniref:Serine-threonine/tyrosine-protein kinase catalytic domain-containing protein n=1 Tax=Astrephomene gubernaculifera TaxID=47775 RepID=A0AAD3DK85_9CHLO|nr:hypothetical protein Agub_g4490 [Astrephomene gubernaculifera]
MYELLVREILIVSYFNTGKGEKMGLTNAEDYARKVCEGFRPPRPTCLADAAWALIADCWHDDPVQRPSMGSVLARLRALREAEAVQPTDPRVMGGCVPGCVLM